jgi:two-component system OmpR family sensor kinase
VSDAEELLTSITGQGSVEVLDRGPGVPEGGRPDIFRRFWRADRRRQGGGGLGLSIVARIVEAHGGSIVVEDRAGGGAVFIQSLPPSAAKDVAG